MRLGPYIEGGAGSVKFKLKTQTSNCNRRDHGEDITLKDIEQYKNMFIKKSMNDEE